MSVFSKLTRYSIWQLLKLWGRTRSQFYRWSAMANAWYSNGTLVLPKTCGFSVPIVVNGRGRVVLGEHVSLGFKKAPMFGNGKIILQARQRDGQITIGSRTTTSNNISIIAHASITIGEGCQLGDSVSIMDCDFHEINPASRNDSPGTSSAVNIGENVWLGSRVMVLKGVHIGDHSVIAAGSVVTKSIPARTVAAGVPARVIYDIKHE